MAPDDDNSDGVARLYRQARAHSDATVAALVLDAPGLVPWRPGPDA